MHMQTPSRRVVLLAAAAGACLPLLAACAAPGGKVAHAGASEAALLARAQAYWDAIKAGDRVTAWDYVAASKNPNVTLQDYVKRGGVTYNRVQIMGVRSLQGDAAVLDVSINYSVPVLNIRNQDKVQPDHWRLIDGAWYHNPPRSVLIPGDDG